MYYCLRSGPIDVRKPHACYYSPSVATIPHGGIDQGPMHQVAQGRGTKTPIERSFRRTGAQPNAPAVTQDPVSTRTDGEKRPPRLPSLASYPCRAITVLRLTLGKDGKNIMNLIVLLIILIILFGGGGFYLGGPYVGGGLGTVLLIVLIILLVGGG